MIQNLQEASFLLPEVILHTGQTDRHTAQMLNYTMYKIQLLPKIANECLDISDLHYSLFSNNTSGFLATVGFAVCAAPHVGSRACQISKCLIGFGRKTFNGRDFFFFLKVLTSCLNTLIFHSVFKDQMPTRTPVRKSTYTASFCHAKGF